MTCEVAQEALSALADGEAAGVDQAGVRAHVETCADCQRFERGVAALRAHLRIVTADDSNEVAERVRARLEVQPPPQQQQRPRRAMSIAAAFLVGLLVGGLLVAGRDGQPSIAAAELPRLVLAAQHEVKSLTADVTLREWGWHADVPARTFAGTLAYEAPERLAVRLEDTTAYPAGWDSGDIDVVVDADRWWTRGLRDCPDLPGCIPAAPRTVAGRGREPFSESIPAPLELITPTTSFALAGEPRSIGSRRIDGREALGVAVSAAQADAWLDALHLTGNLRQVHPTDEVEVWLDTTHLVPLLVRVVARGHDDRRRWAASHGYRDEPGRPVLEVRLRGLHVNDAVANESFPPAAKDAVVVDAGFRSTDDASGPDRLVGLTRHTVGRVSAGGPPVDVAAYTDGRAWLTVRRTDAWSGDLLFGDLGDVVRPIDIGGGAPAYVSEGGTRIAIHGRGVDVVLTGSVDAATLQRAASALGIDAQPLPDGWAERESRTLAATITEHRDLLVPRRVSGFGTPAVRVEAETVTIAYAGPGSRGFLVTRTAATNLAPPLDPDTRAIRVRGTAGRYSPRRGELEWVEGGAAYSLQSATLPEAELLEVARTMAPAPTRSR